VKIGIVGAGATGLAAGYDLAAAGHEVVLLEAASEIGGLAGSLDINGTPLERYYHHIFGSDRDFIQLIDELGLSAKLRFHATTTGIFYEDQLLDFSTPLEMLKFSPISPADRVRFGASSAALKLVKNGDRFADVNALTWLRRWAGRGATAAVWEPLLRGKFGDEAENISMAWLWARVHSRTFKLGYLDGGFAQVYQRLAEEIAAHGGTLRTGEPVQRISRASADRPVEVVTTAGEYSFDRLLVTIPYPLFAKALGEVPAEGLTSTRYLGATCFVLRLDRSLIPYYWLNINDPSFPFLAVVEHTRMIDPAQYGGDTVVYVGNYVPTDDWRYTSEPKELLERFEPFLQRIAPHFALDQVRGWEFSRAPHAQPIVTPGYRDRIPPHETALPGVLLGSMAQVYPYDRGQNYAVEMGRRLAKQLVHNTI
jgi:protoporphyrinogen oxidase